jgi:hypothetical protein
MGRHKGSFNKKKTPADAGGEIVPTPPPDLSFDVTNSGLVSGKPVANRYRAVNTIMLAHGNYYPGDIFEMSPEEVAQFLACGACEKVENDGC